MNDKADAFAGLLEDLPMISAASVSAGTQKRLVFGPGRFFDDYVVRYFALPPWEVVPVHNHEWPHYIITLHGHGEVIIDGDPWDLPEQSWAHVPADVPHSYTNKTGETWNFLCIVPWRGDPQGRRTQYRMIREMEKKNKEKE